MPHKEIEQFETTGILQMILLLLEQPRFITELIRSTFNPEGVGAQTAMNNSRMTLKRFGLVEEYTDGKRPRLYLRLTGKGIDVAHHLKAIEEILQEEH